MKTPLRTSLLAEVLGTAILLIFGTGAAVVTRKPMPWGTEAWQQHSGWWCSSSSRAWAKPAAPT